MKELQSPHITQLIDNEEDSDFIYLVLEYCDGGDLTYYQSKVAKDMTFTADKASKVLSQVILGL